MMEIVKIPEKRKAVIIGKGGETKKMIEKMAGVSISIGNDIEIKGDVLPVMKAKDIIKAIGRGFSPEKALALIDDEYRLEIITLSDKNENALKRIRSRIIGTGGSTREKIERYTHTYVSIYGKTISIIGKWNDVDKARFAIDMLLEGKPHQSVYKYLKNIKEVI